MFAFRWVLVASVIGAIGAAGHEPQTQIGNSKAELFAWFDTLGFNDRLSGPFVCYEDWRMTNGRRKLESRHYGFRLASETVYGFRRAPENVVPTLYTMGLWQFGIFSESTEAELFVTVDFEQAARRQIALQSKYESSSLNRGRSPDQSAPWSSSREPFVWARIAERRGLSDLSDRLLGIAIRLAVSRENLRSQLERDLGETAFEDIKSDINRPEIPFSTIRQECVFFIERFPKDESLAIAKSYVKTIDKMAEADRIFAATDQGTGEDAEIARLIHDLQNQFGQNLFSDGGARVLSGSSRRDNSPAARLLRKEYRAIPQLVAALKDDRLTRSVGSGRRVPTDSVGRVHDAVVEILEEIIPDDLTVDDSDVTSEQRQRDPEGVAKAWRAKYARRVQKWYVDFLKKGERQMLIENVRRGGYRVAEPASRLVARYPQDAAAAIAYGLAHAKDTSPESYIKPLAKLETAEGRDLLWQLFDRAEKYDVRIAAAEALCTKEPERVLKGLIEDWPKHADDDRLLALLTSSGKEEALNTIGRGLMKQEPDVRFAVADSLISGCSAGWEPEADPEEDIPQPPRPPTNECAKAAERLLVQLLLDTVEQTGLLMGMGDVEFRAPRTCDVAAYALSQLMPAKYRHEFFDSTAEMDVQRWTFANIWRSENHLPLLELPKRPTIEPVDGAALDVALASYTSAPTAESRRKVIALGLGALPGILSRAEGQGTAGGGPFGPLAATVSCIVRKVDIAGPNVPDSARKLVASWRGQPLTGEKVLALLKLLEEQLEPSARGFVFKAERPGDGTGFAVSLDCSGVASKKASPGSWAYHTRLRLGSETLIGASGSGTNPFSGEPRDEEWETGLHEAMSASPRTSISIFVDHERD